MEAYNYEGWIDTCQWLQKRSETLNGELLKVCLQPKIDFYQP